MHKTQNNCEFIAPEINMIETDSPDVLCASDSLGGGTQDYEQGDWNPFA